MSEEGPLAENAREIARNMHKIACEEGRHEWNPDTDYCKWCSKWKGSITLSMVDAQSIESRQFPVEEIARFFSVRPSKLWMSADEVRNAERTWTGICGLSKRW